MAGKVLTDEEREALVVDYIESHTKPDMKPLTQVDAGDMIKYQGAEIHWLYFDELTHFTKPMYDYLRTRLRANKKLGITPCVRCASNPGEGTMLAETEVTTEIKQYGDHAEFSDLIDLTHLDVTLARKVELFGNAGARAIDTVVREELATCPNVIYAGGKTSRSALTAADKLTSIELRKAVRTLKKNLAEKFGGYYVAIVGPDTVYDLQDDENFVKVSAYQDKENIYTGEVGRLYGIRFVETTEAKIFEGAGASGADVASVIVLGKYAYGLTSIRGGAAPHAIVKPAGSAGTADPLDQINSVGWKLDAFAVKLLQPEFAVRIECGFTA